MTPSNQSELIIELGTPLLLETEATNGRIKSVFTGMQKDNCLMVRLPLGEGLGASFSDGTGVTVRFFNQGRVVGFRSQVMGKYLKGPLRFVFLAYPKQLETHNLRNSARLPGYLPARINLEGAVLNGVVTDVGKGGVRFLHRLEGDAQELPPLVLGQSAILLCPLCGIEGTQEITCKIRNLSQDGTYLQLGVEFQGLDQNIQSQINRYVDQVLAMIEDEAHA